MRMSVSVTDDVLGGEGFERLLRARDRGDAVARLFEQTRDDGAHQVFVFGDEDEWLWVHKAVDSSQ